jgi:hypothetical protein
MHLPESAGRHPPLAAHRLLDIASNQLDSVTVRPTLPDHRGHRKIRMRKEAVIYRLDNRRPMAMQPRDAVVVDRESQPGSPVQALDIARHRFDLDGDIELRDLPQLVLDHGGLEAALFGKRNVLPVATPATSWA